MSATGGSIGWLEGGQIEMGDERGEGDWSFGRSVVITPEVLRYAHPLRLAASVTPTVRCCSLVVPTTLRLLV